MTNPAASENNDLQKYIATAEKQTSSKTGKPKKLSAVKKLVLKTLWDSSTSFPRDWVLSDRLYELTNQKYIDRRIRELRNETGCDIETGTHNGAHAYRLLSATLNQAFDRTYLTDTQKKKLFEAYEYRCAACSQQFGPKSKGLQADHRVPLIRGGGSEIENWQPLCIACNVAKRRSCMGCEVNCAQCAWAFPEQYGQTIPIQLSRELGESLQALARSRDMTPQALIFEAIAQLLGRSSDS